MRTPDDLQPAQHALWCVSIPGGNFTREKNRLAWSQSDGILSAVWGEAISVFGEQVVTFEVI
jgi:hypothetical protein